ncbi:hypothetical protein D3C80_1048420 [compost metagenome]
MIITCGYRSVPISKLDGIVKINVKSADRVNEMLKAFKVCFDIVVQGAGAEIAHRLNGSLGSGMPVALHFTQDVCVIDFGITDVGDVDSGITGNGDQINRVLVGINMSQHDNICTRCFLFPRICTENQDIEAGLLGFSRFVIWCCGIRLRGILLCGRWTIWYGWLGCS